MPNGPRRDSRLERAVLLRRHPIEGWLTTAVMVLVLGSAGLALPSRAQAATSVLSVTALVGAQDAVGDFPVTITWAPAPGTDSSTTSYDVALTWPGAATPWSTQHIAQGTNTVVTMVGNATVVAQVVAIDSADGSRSATVESAAVRVPPTTYTFGAPRIMLGRKRVLCGTTVATACTVRSLRGLTMSSDVTPARNHFRAVYATRLARSYRKPGLRALRKTFSVAWGHGAGSSPAEGKLDDSIIRAAGVWCLRPTLADNPALVTAAGVQRCVRYRPPVSIAWAGDTTLGSRTYGLSPNGGRSVLARVREVITKADLAIDNYEGTLSSQGSARCSGGALCFTFQAPPRYAAALAWAGFDIANQANNHALDYGSAARRESVVALRRAGLGVVGLPARTVYRQVADTRVAVLGFSHSAGTDSIRDLHVTRARVRDAASHADVVVVVMHAGTEGAASAHVPRGDERARGENRGNTRAFVHAAIDAGADVVFGSGPHVVRGIEARRGHLAFYSTGNFAGWHNFSLGGAGSQSGIVEVTVDERGVFVNGTWRSVTIDRPGVPRLDRGGSTLRRVQALSREDFGSGAAHLNTRSGNISLP
ncbi:MAG: CapA family protein [Thermoleophilia bacterium]|nr:CapA family protein [Thermoleophilia bacterium]